jgi:hypothetical protein
MKTVVALLITLAAVSGCVVLPADYGPAYVAPAPAFVVSPAPVVVWPYHHRRHFHRHHYWR